MSGALAAIGRDDSPPVPPLNLIGDFGGGGMFLALGLVSALLKSKSSGKGQVVDAAMTDGSAVNDVMYSMHQSGFWNLERQTNLLDGAAHFYDTYKCKDGKFISLGSIEPQFYAFFRCEKAELSQTEFGEQMKRETWKVKRKDFVKYF